MALSIIFNMWLKWDFQYLQSFILSLKWVKFIWKCGQNSKCLVIFLSELWLNNYNQFNDSTYLLFFVVFPILEKLLKILKNVFSKVSCRDDFEYQESKGETFVPIFIPEKIDTCIQITAW